MAFTVAVGASGVASTAAAASGARVMALPVVANTRTSTPSILFRTTGALVSRSAQRVNMLTVADTSTQEPGGLGKWERQEAHRAAQREVYDTARAEAARQSKAAAHAKAVRVAAAEAAASTVAAKVAAETLAAETLAAKVAAEAQAQAQAQANQPGTVTTPDPGIKTWAAAQLTRMGYGPEQFSCLDQLWTRESGWNPLADNPTSDAYGIPQALPGAKMAEAGPDWRTNPKTQISWGLGYIQNRYLDPCRAWAHSEQVNWY